MEATKAGNVKEIDEDNNNDYNMKHQSNFGHSHCIELAARSSDTLGGTSRLRLAPFAPTQAGSTSYEKLLPVVSVINLQTCLKNGSFRTVNYSTKSKGADTTFYFQNTCHSRERSSYGDPMTSSTLHRSCSMLEGDYRSFVVHSDKV